MKRKFQKNKSAFNIRLNEEEFEMIRILKDDFAINISHAFKKFLREYLLFLQKRKTNCQTYNKENKV